MTYNSNVLVDDNFLLQAEILAADKNFRDMHKMFCETLEEINDKTLYFSEGMGGVFNKIIDFIKWIFRKLFDIIGFILRLLMGIKNKDGSDKQREQSLGEAVNSVYVPDTKKAVQKSAKAEMKEKVFVMIDALRNEMKANPDAKGPEYDTLKKALDILDDRAPIYERRTSLNNFTMTEIKSILEGSARSFGLDPDTEGNKTLFHGYGLNGIRYQALTNAQNRFGEYAYIVSDEYGRLHTDVLVGEISNFARDSYRVLKEMNDLVQTEISYTIEEEGNHFDMLREEIKDMEKLHYELVLFYNNTHRVKYMSKSNDYLNRVKSGEIVEKATNKEDFKVRMSTSDFEMKTYKEMREKLHTEINKSAGKIFNDGVVSYVPILELITKNIHLLEGKFADINKTTYINKLRSAGLMTQFDLFKKIVDSCAGMRKNMDDFNKLKGVTDELLNTMKRYSERVEEPIKDFMDKIGNTLKSVSAMSYNLVIWYMNIFNLVDHCNKNLEEELDRSMMILADGIKDTLAVAIADWLYIQYEKGVRNQ